MITDIPSHEDFAAYGIAYLNLAWDAAVTLLREIEDIDDEEIRSDYLIASQRSLAMSVNLCHQALDFLLKGRIVEISPFLLICGRSSDWPKGVDKKDISFSEFHTPDSQELIRIHNSVYPARLSQEFINSFEESRKLRNALMHTIDKRIALSARDVILNILLASETFIGDFKWPATRRNYLNSSRESYIYEEGPDYIICLEIEAVFKNLDRRDIHRFFGFDRNRRGYRCPICYRASGYVEFNNAFAVLEPNSPNSSEIYCFVCETKSIVVRKACTKPNCRGNVVDPDWSECLTCGAVYEEE